MQTIGLIVKGPKKFFSDVKYESKELYNKALITASVSIVFNSFFMVRILELGHEGDTLYLYILQYVFVFVASYVIYSWVIYCSWRLVGSKEAFKPYFIITLYSASVSIVFATFALLASWGFVKTNFPEFLSFMIEDALKPSWNNIVPPELQAQAVYSTLAFSIPFIVGIFWLFLCWGAYRKINQASKIRSFCALVISIVLTIPVGFIVMNMQNAVSPL